MAFISGKDSFFSVDGTDISSYVNQLSLSRDVNTLETTSFGSDQATFVVGIEGLSFLDLQHLMQQLMVFLLDCSMAQQWLSTIDQTTHLQLQNTLEMLLSQTTQLTQVQLTKYHFISVLLSLVLSQEEQSKQMVSNKRKRLKSNCKRSGNSDRGLWRGYCQPEKIDRASRI